MAPRLSSGFVYSETLFAPTHPSDPLFSGAYKSLPAQTLSFHIHTKPWGCHPVWTPRPFSVSRCLSGKFPRQSLGQTAAVLS
jgi:hypothetical protein